MAFGILLLAWTLWDMTAWTPDIGRWPLILNTTLQGFALGFVFIPLNLVAFATLDPALRTDGAALVSLVRNIGSAIGIAVMSSLLVSNTQVMHASLAEHVSLLNRLFTMPGIAEHWNPATAAGAAALNTEITRQATIVAYLNDFWLLLAMAAVMLLLLPLMRRPPREAAAGAPHAATD
jgi:DHA2 family multidrug resistance protein